MVINKEPVNNVKQTDKRKYIHDKGERINKRGGGGGSERVDGGMVKA